MANTEKITVPFTGEPGAIIDEHINRSGKSELLYAFYNEKGLLTSYLTFWRGVTPEEISDTINDLATELLETNPKNYSDDELLDKVRALRHQADHVPDLWPDLGVE
jgi:hypothetical protein